MRMKENQMNKGAIKKFRATKTARVVLLRCPFFGPTINGSIWAERQLRPTSLSWAFRTRLPNATLFMAWGARPSRSPRPAPRRPHLCTTAESLSKHLSAGRKFGEDLGESPLDNLGVLV
jgi:hypothetical protein